VARHATRPLFLSKQRDGHWLATTYTEFGELVDDVRGGLAVLDVGPGDRVGIIAGNRLEWAVAAYATYGRSAAFVPMFESQLEREWAFVARDAGIKVLLVGSPEIYRRVAMFPRLIPTLRHLVLLAGDGAPLTFASLRQTGGRRPVSRLYPGPEDVACLLYTPSAAGEPKGVVLSHGNVLSNVLALQSVVPLGEDHRTLSCLPWARAFGHTAELHAAIAAGASLAIADSADRIADDLADVRPTVLLASPAVLERVHASFEAVIAAEPAPLQWLARRGVDAGKRRSRGERLGPAEALIRLAADRLVFARVRARVGGRLEFAVSGEGSVAPEVAALIDAMGIAVYEGYGLTETSPVVAANVPGCSKLGSVGRPIPGVRVVIDHGALAAGGAAPEKSDQDGEIVVYGPNVMQGYHNRDDENRVVFTPDGGLRTGDVGHVDGDGFLFITGRIEGRRPRWPA
jgi:long-chain acyl-CoA synthetase